MRYRITNSLLKFSFTCFIIFLSFKSVFSQQPDTLLLPFDNGKNGELSKSEHRKLIKRIHKSDVFYSRLKQFADSGYIYKQIYPLIFRKPQIAEDFNLNNIPVNANFKQHEGKTIRSIKLIKLPAFGSSIYDTVLVESSGLAKTLNNLHITTRDVVVRKYLKFKPGESLDPTTLSDNERIIRNADIFQDARFIIDPVDKKTVDVILVIKDVFPLGADLKVNSINNVSARFYNRNILGFGHHLSQSIGYHRDYKPSFFPGDGLYVIRNIRNSFTDLSFFWSGNPINNRLGFKAERPFITPEIKYAGGISVLYNKAWLYDNIDYESFRFSNRFFDVWAGYAIVTNRLKSITARRQQIALTAGFYQLDYFKTPQFSILNHPPMLNTTRLLFGLNILRSEYYQTNMLYGYGRTEDIFFGHHAELVFGWEQTEYKKRIYNGIKFDFVQPVKNAGMVGLDFELGGYLKNGIYEEGVLKTTFKIISPLVPIGRNSIRNFGFIGYTTGLDRNTPGFIKVNDGTEASLFKKYDIAGYQRIRARIESVIFTHHYILGFRFAPFMYAESAVIAPKYQKMINQTIYPAIGVGIRLRNENLAFSTFQISIGYHPIAPKGVSLMEFNFSDLPAARFDQYLINKPEIVEFR